MQTLEWLTPGDVRTCAVCSALDGKVFPIGKFPPQFAHPHCRCTNTVARPLAICGWDLAAQAAPADRQGDACILPLQAHEGIAGAQAAETAALKQAFESGDIGELEQLTSKQLQTLAQPSPRLRRAGGGGVLPAARLRRARGDGQALQGFGGHALQGFAKATAGTPCKASPRLRRAGGGGVLPSARLGRVQPSPRLRRAGGGKVSAGSCLRQGLGGPGLRQGYGGHAEGVLLDRGDLGYTRDPTEIVVFEEEWGAEEDLPQRHGGHGGGGEEKSEGSERRLRMVLRVHMASVGYPQIACCLAVLDGMYGPAGIGLDHGGNGSPSGPPFINFGPF